MKYRCDECDVSFPCRSGTQKCIRLPQQEPVAYVTGYYAGRCVVRAIDPAVVLPEGMALYTTPQIVTSDYSNSHQPT